MTAATATILAMKAGSSANDRTVPSNRAFTPTTVGATASPVARAAAPAAMISPWLGRSRARTGCVTKNATDQVAVTITSQYPKRGTGRKSASVP